jgi:hypothetical protein
MAYKYTVAKSCANRNAVLTELWSQLSAMGWTLHDNQDGSSYRVYKSNGEAGDRIYEYAKINWTTSNQITVVTYGWWNNSTHAGSCGIASNYYPKTVTTSESGCYLWVYGDKNIVYFVVKTGSTYVGVGFGHIPNRFWTTLTDLTSAASSGSNVSIEVSDSGAFVVNQYYQIFGSAGEGRDRVQVTAKADSTHLTIASLPRNYGIGALIGQTPSTFGAFCTANYFCLNNPYSISGTTDCATTQGSCTITYPFLNTACDPDQRGDTSYVLMPFCFNEESNALVGWIDSNLLKVSPTGLTAEDTLTVRQRDSGTAESSGNNTIVDSDKSWETNAFVGKVIVITFGTGIGQIRKILSNTDVSVAVTENWTVNPSTDSQYVIADEAYRFLFYGSYDLVCACREGI